MKLEIIFTHGLQTRAAHTQLFSYCHTLATWRSGLSLEVVHIGSYWRRPVLVGRNIAHNDVSCYRSKLGQRRGQ